MPDTTALALFFLMATTPVFVNSSVHDWCQQHQPQILSSLVELVAIPNLASDTANINKNAEMLVHRMTKLGLAPRLLYPPGKKGPPAIYGELKAEGATRTLVLYAHYDGQPVDPKKWSGGQPWQPVLRSASLENGGRPISIPAAGAAVDPQWRLYGRSAADDKTGVIALLSAVEALRATGQKPTSNLKFFLEGEEEAGSPNLEAIVNANKELLK